MLSFQPLPPAHSKPARMADAVRVVAGRFVGEFPGAIPGPGMSRRWWKETGALGKPESFRSKLLREVMALQPELPRSDFRSVREVRNKADKAHSYARRKEAGNCPDCGAAKPPLGKHSLCDRCRDRHATQAKAPRRKQSLRARVALGFCVNHAMREAVPGRTLCAVCLEALVEATIQWRDRKRAEALAQGNCSTCFTRKARKNMKTCQHCAEQGELRQARAKAKRQGLSHQHRHAA